MFKKIAAVIGFVVIIGAWAAGGSAGRDFARYLFRSSDQNEEEIYTQVQKGLHLAAAQINRNVPLMVDDETRLDSAVASSDKLTYYYTFPNYSSRDVSYEVVKERVLPNITRTVCGDEDMIWTMKYGIQYVYVYRGNDRRDIASFQIAAADCR